MQQYQDILLVSVFFGPVLGLTLLFYWHTGANTRELAKCSIGITGLVSILVSVLLVLSIDTAKELSPMACYAFTVAAYTLISAMAGSLAGCLVNCYLPLKSSVKAAKKIK